MEAIATPAPPADAVPLTELAVGQRARLVLVPDVEARVALLQMGVPPGAILTLTDRATGGCPLAIQVHGTKLALRAELARRIRVQRLPA